MAYQKNEIVTVTIDDIGNDGEGIGKVDGYTLFVKDAVIGDMVEARITKPKKNYAYARCEKIITASEYRDIPRCAFHRQCGGCQIQALSYDAQLSFKQNKVRGNLVRLGGFSEEEVDAVMEPVVGMEEPYHYRNKALFPVGRDRNGRLVTGFYAGRTHDIIANTDCQLGVVDNKEILEIILEYMEHEHVQAYQEETGTGLVRHVLIRKGFTSGQIMVCLVINGDKLPSAQKLIDRLCVISGMTSICINTNTEKTNVVLGKKTKLLWGEDTIEDQIHVRDVNDFHVLSEVKAVSYRISAQSFYQVNPVQTEKLYSLALDYAGLTGQETVWDLYCGIGTISLFLARKAKQVYGVEIIPQAIDDARRNAARNGIDNARFFVGKAEEVLPEFYNNSDDSEEMTHPDVIVVDPPRKGCDVLCLETMLKMQPSKIVYVSCDSATLARDLRILVDGGYKLEKVRPVDQFAQTVHVETVVQLSKGDIDKESLERKSVAKNSDTGMISSYGKENKTPETTNVKIDFSLENLDLSELRGKATYEQIKDYVREQTGFRVSTLCISQVKRKCGLEVGESYNKPKSEDAKQPQCTPEKEAAIMQALRHYGMI